MEQNMNQEVNEKIDGTDNTKGTQNYRHLWVQWNNCHGLNYKKKYFKTKMNISKECGFHLKMSSCDRMELLIDQGTWNPTDEDMVLTNLIEFDLSA